MPALNKGMTLDIPGRECKAVCQGYSSHAYGAIESQIMTRPRVSAAPENAEVTWVSFHCSACVPSLPWYSTRRGTCSRYLSLANFSEVHPRAEP
ncbi:hypothetical protein SCP_1203150 [Sparassis crispa]|uniref:Uncharacterized protein n=1 Tax=Sparassis crispa TaxID=139825 RepID=A0A401H0Y2_9APHY|nr:hypothetical protein SCP_1203150 [Sparassis crispa]GBE88086.1 hypothetical protein SCP_1203150 [Sparassis crispa]